MRTLIAPCLRWLWGNMLAQKGSLVWLLIATVVLIFGYQVLDAYVSGRGIAWQAWISEYGDWVIVVSLFVWSCILFTTFAPLGSVTILAAGFLLGPWAGLIQYSALLLTSVWLYRVFDMPDDELSIRSYTHNRRILGMFDAVDGRPILTGCVLRLIPVVPSAACVFISRILEIDLREMVIATLLTGWVRPIALATAGATAGGLWTTLMAGG